MRQARNSMNYFKRISAGIIVIGLLIIIGCSRNINSEQAARQHLIGWWLGFSKEVNMEVMIHFFQNEDDNLIFEAYTKAEGDTSWGFHFAGNWKTLSKLDSVSNKTSFGASLTANNNVIVSLIIQGIGKFASSDSTYFNKSVPPKFTKAINNEKDAKSNLIGWWQYINPETGAGVGYNFEREKVFDVYCDRYNLKNDNSNWVNIDMRGKCNVFEKIDENTGYKYYGADINFAKYGWKFSCDFYGLKNLIVSNQDGKLLYKFSKTNPPE